MSDTSGMLPNWLSEAVGDQQDARRIAQAICQAKEWIDIINEAVKEATQIMQAKRSGSAGGYPSYNQEVSRAIVTRLASLYPEISLSRR